MNKAMLQHFLPLENVTYTTKLPVDKVLQQLAKQTEPKKIFRWGKGERTTYEGTVEGNSFSISRIIGYRNSFLPVIKGEVTENAKGTTIKVRMRLQLFVLLFLFLWGSGWAVGVLKSNDNALILILVVAYAVAWSWVHSSTRVAKRKNTSQWYFKPIATTERAKKNQ